MTSPNRSADNKASRESRGWAGPDPGRLPRIVAVGIALLAPIPAHADLLHLRGGRTLSVDGCRQAGDELKCRFAGGEIGFPLDQIDRIEKQARPPVAGPARRSPAGAAAPLATALEVAAPLAGEPTPEAAQARIEVLGRALAAPRADTRAIRAELSVLHAWLGNVAMLGSDFEGAEQHYVTALGYDPGLVVARLNRATALINLNRYDAADGILHETLSEDPDNARALDLLGESAVQRGRIAEGIALWEKSLTLQPSDPLRGRLERARRLLEAEEGFSSTTGAHFALKFDGGQASPGIAEEILDYLEEGFAELSSRFAHEPEAIIQTILYSKRSFQQATASPDWVGGLFDGQIRIPIQGLTHLTPQMKRVLIHELTHCFVASRSRGNAPKWIHEGIAQVAEGRSASRERATILASYKAAAGAEGGPPFSYPSALSQMEFFLERWSGSHLNEMLDHLGRGDDIDASLRPVTGLTYAEFLREWSEWLDR